MEGERAERGPPSDADRRGGLVPPDIDLVHDRPDAGRSVRAEVALDRADRSLAVASLPSVVGVEQVDETGEVSLPNGLLCPRDDLLYGLRVRDDEALDEHGQAHGQGQRQEGGTAGGTHGGAPTAPRGLGRIASMSEESQRFCELGEEHLRRDEPEEALVWYDRAVREDPDSSEAWGGRGKACYHLGQLERADRSFRKALKVLSPRVKDRSPRRGWWGDEAGRDYLRLVHWRALCRFWMGLYDEAARMFRRILKLAPSDPLEVRFLLGETYFRMGDLDRAIEEFERAGDDPEAIVNLGLARFYQGDFVRSVNAFRRGIFENVHLACRLADLDPPATVPTYRGTHPKELDGDDAALDYTDRCGDLWFGRPLLQRWIRAIYEHPTVQKDLGAHLEQVQALASRPLEPGDRARLEGANAQLRSAERLTKTDGRVAADVMRLVFRPPA